MLVLVFHTLPSILIAPIAGVLVDRLDRRLVMIVSDSCSALATVCMALLFVADQLMPWHIYTYTLLTATCGVFQWLAYSAAVAALVPARHLSRANGLVELASAVAGVLAPLAAGFLVGLIGLEGIILIDFISFLLATGALLLVRFPRVRSEAVQPTLLRFWRDFQEGWRYMAARRGLLALVAFNALIGVIAVSEALITPLVLSFADEQALGMVLGAGGLGMLLGSGLISLWGGPKRLVIGAVAFECVAGASTVLAGLRPSLPLVMMAVFMLHFTYPIIGACNQTLWQRKTPPALHGRVFAVRRMLSYAALPLTFLLAGPLVDHTLEPSMQMGGIFADSAGKGLGWGVDGALGC